MKTMVNKLGVLFILRAALCAVNVVIFTTCIAEDGAANKEDSPAPGSCQEYAIVLSAREWKRDILPPNARRYFKFAVTQGVNYKIDWKEKGDDAAEKNINVYITVSAYYESGFDICKEHDNSYAEPVIFTAQEDGFIIVMVEAEISKSASGEYLIRCAPYLPPPEGLQAQVNAGVVVLSWQGTADGVYTVYRKPAQPVEDYEVIDEELSEPYFTDQSCEAGSAVNYKVAFFRPDFDCGLSEAVRAELPAAVLSRPANFRSSSSAPDTINLSWNEVSGAACYSVFRSKRFDTGYKPIAGSITALQYTDCGLQSAAGYYYKLKAWDSAGGASPLSAYTTAKTMEIGALSAPARVSAAGASTSSITVTWDAVDGARFYDVFRYKTAGISTPLDSRYTVHAAALESPSFTDEQLESNYYYFYKIKAYNPNAESGRSPYAKAMCIPRAPTINRLQAESSSSVLILINAVSMVTAYKIYRAPQAAGGENPDVFTYIGETTTTEFTDANLEPNTTYYYKASAFRALGGESELSSPAKSVKTKMP